ncbi:hypothetical protein P0M11_11155 [Kaistella sp. PBT33-4]|uniref:hypothetical protein n=1 Tax=Kaistella sp. PBT33-4 TaxID=3032000 RepID=UPI0023D889F8|nr:hypothetical protein [Kaistella sp. PBT33-4]MDF0720555.1 hypothetical protein [Kaistella sp. PBT33-4]
MPVTTSPSLPTTAESHGRNLRPELRAESWFFLENTNYSQTAGNQFGVLSSTVFRTTSRIQFTGKVYSICSGQIFIQPHGSDATKVNLILKPFRQPINGLPIKYIVYRGLQKNNFFDANDVVLDQGNTKATGLTKRIWKEFEDFYANNTALTKPPFKAWLIGFPNPGAATAEQQSPEDYIDDYFFKLSNPDSLPNEPQKKAFELPMIPGGTYIGDAQGSLGVDIVLNEGDFTIENDPNPFTLNLSYSRATDHTLNTSLGATEFLKKLIRESATQFIDIAAFYGLHAQGKGKIYLQAPATAANTPDAIYNLISNFQTKNTVYLYIQSNRQRSYNFYGNYDLNGKNIKIGTDVNNLIEKQFGTGGWPIEQIINITPQKVLLQFLHEREFNIPILYSHYRDVENTKSVYYATSQELNNTNSTNLIEYTIPVELTLDVVNSTSVSSLIHVRYEGMNLGIDNFNVFPLTSKSNYLLLHAIFPKINIRQNLINEDNALTVFEDYTIVPVSLLSYSEVLLTNCKIITDLGKKLIAPGNQATKNRKTFITHCSRYADDSNIKSSRFLNLDNQTERIEPIRTLEFIYSEKGFSLHSHVLQENGVDFKTLSLRYNGKIINEYFHLGITAEELGSLNQLIPATACNVRFKFNEETNYNMDFENDVVFYKFSLGIIFENNLGNLEEIFPSQGIHIYGIKINFLASKEYAEFEYKAVNEQVTV